MTSLTPINRAPDKSVPIVLGIAGAAAVIIVLGVLYGLIFGGWLSGFGHWMYATNFGTVVRYALESLILLVCVLLSTAVLIYAERKLWAAVQLRRGPNVVGPWGTLQPFADFLKFILKEPVIPSGANKGVFLLAPLVGVVLAMAAWAVIPVSRRLGGRRYQRRHSLSVRDLLARRLRHHHGRLGVELQIRLPVGAARGGADGFLRSLDRLRHRHRAALRRFAQPHRHRARAGHLGGRVRLVLAAAVADVRDLLRLGAGRDQPAAVRSRRRPNRNWSPAIRSNMRPRCSCCSSSASWWRSWRCRR